MAHKFANSVLETCTAPGTGACTLTGAVFGYQTFASECAVNDTVHYRIEAVNGLGIPTGDWELGRGTYSATNVLTRTTVYESSNANAAVNFAGAVRVSITALSPATAAQVRTDWLSALNAIQQGGGTGQNPNKIYIGWRSADLGLMVDSTDFGATWPIHITGNAGTATGLTAGNKTITGSLAVATGMGFIYDGGNYNYLGMGSGLTGAWAWRWDRSTGAISWMNSGFTSVMSCDGSGSFAAASGVWSGGRVTANGTEIASLYAPTGGVYVSHNYGMYVQGSHTSAGVHYVNLVSGDPAYQTCQYYLIHVPGSWAGHEWGVNGQGFRFRHDGWAEAPAGHRATSDGNVKINREKITDALDKVDQLTGYTYDRTDITNMDGTLLHAAGLIAQDVQAVLPESVSQAKPTEEDPDPLRRLSYDGVVALLVNAVKELHAEVKDLRAELKVLRKQRMAK
jgi:hypothetical protein